MVRAFLPANVHMCSCVSVSVPVYMYVSVCVFGVFFVVVYECACIPRSCMVAVPHKDMGEQHSAGRGPWMLLSSRALAKKYVVNFEEYCFGCRCCRCVRGSECGAPALPRCSPPPLF